MIEVPRHTQMNQTINKNEVPFVPKLLPPLPRVSPTNQANVDQVCFQWNNGQKGLEPSMLCFASSKAEGDQLRHNPFSGIYINYLYGQQSCDKYQECSQKGRKFQFDTNSQNHQLDLGHGFENMKQHAVKVCQPTIETGSNYLQSWTNGFQEKFMKSYFNAIKEGEGVNLAKKMINSLSTKSKDEE
ncbi:hypothetical protein K502DRAFT_325535 [Neoconidiobolus thromboides FSU 785]|nr:hypothetical protein K502DRAFT_325535 [Neoconidiobolus thromboides FSU 785]